MLNANAKSFVPPQADIVPQPSVESLYRYRIDVPPQRLVDASTNARNLNSVSSLLSAKYLFSIRGGREQYPLQYFLDNAFLSAVNLPATEVSESLNSGFLLSKQYLALHADMGVINALNDMPGFLIHIDVPREFGAEVMVPIGYAWEFLSSRLFKDPFVTAFGYVRSVVGRSDAKTSGSFRHYFFAACTRIDGQDSISLKSLSDLQIPLSKVTPVTSIVPYVCGSRCPFAVFITVGEEAKSALSKGTSADAEFTIDIYGNDYARSIESYEAAETFIHNVMQENHRWEKTVIMHLHLHCVAEADKPGFLPIAEIVFNVGCLCDGIGAIVAGISLSPQYCTYGFGRLVAQNLKPPCWVNGTLTEMLEKQSSFDTSTAVHGSFPLHICRGITRVAAQAVAKALSQSVSDAEKRLENIDFLSRMNFAEAADRFAKRRLFARRRAVGTPLLIGTDSSSNLFAVDLKTKGCFLLRNGFGVGTGLLRDCLFTGTLCSSNRGFYDYHLVIDDIMSFQGTDLRHLPFAERWRYVENMDLGNEESWPHAEASHLVVVRAGYVCFDRIEALSNMPPGNFLTSGIVLVDDTLSGTNDAGKSLLSWIPPAAITARFSVHKVESAPEDNSEVKRVFLSSLKNGDEEEFVPYENEFTDVLGSAFPTLDAGSIVECILRRAPDGAHWWDAVRYFKKGTEVATTFAEIDQLVHSPGITKSELLWLLKAPTYQCERCHKVNDAGRYNSAKNAYWCKNCWVETGHGDCSYCGRQLAAGLADGSSRLFFCSNCWTSFSTPNSQAEIGYHVPPPPNATFTQQVTTRCISLLIDLVSPKSPTNDVLDLCCGGSVVRKWMRNKTTNYIGIDLKASVVDTTNEIISSSTNELPAGSNYTALCADVFSDDFWTQSITKIHPRQFHVVSCFAGLHHVFSDEARARRFLGSIANALVPGGIFIGISTDASSLYAKGTTFENSIVKVEWPHGGVPRIGNTFSILINGGALREENVIPIDFLVAVASEYGLEVTTEACQSFRELIEKDASWTKAPTSNEKEYLCTLRTFAFRKEGSELVPCDAKALK